MKKYTPTYRDVQMGGGYSSVEVFMDEVPNWLEGLEQAYVKADLAEEMLVALKEALSLIEDMWMYEAVIAPTRVIETGQMLETLIKKAEEA